MSNSIDALLSIAVLHHLTDEMRRLNCIRELIRILKPDGELLIQVWAFEQDERSKKKFTKRDNFIEYNSSDKKVCELRYYHVFKEGELDNLIKNVPDVEIIKSYWEMGNWVYFST